MTENMRDLGNVLRDWRREQGFTLEQLSKKSNIDLSAISRYETGKRKLTLEVIEKINVSFVDTDKADSLLIAYLRVKFPNLKIFKEK